MPVASKFHKEVIAAVRDLYGDGYVTGWPDTEVNLGYMCGYKDVNLRADILLELSSQHALVIEVHSTLHNDKGKNAWGRTRDQHEAALGRDKLKIEMCNQLGFGFVAVWPEDKDYIKKIQDAADGCPLAVAKIVVPKGAKSALSLGNGTLESNSTMQNGSSLGTSKLESGKKLR